MWDDSTVAWRIPAPWFRRNRHFRSGRYHPALVTVWHVDPHGDRGYPRGNPNDKRRLWRFHLHHWQVQIHPWQDFKRWAFERCAYCGLRYPWGYAPVRHGEGTVHRRCSEAITYREKAAQLEDCFREAVWGYCRTNRLTAAEAVEVLIPANTGDLPQWRKSYLARSVMGVLDAEGEHGE